MKTLNQILGRPNRLLAVLMALLAFSALAIPSAFAATTVFLDANGTSPGFWDGVLNPVNCTVTTTATWTTDPTGVATPVLGTAANNFQFGVSPSDFNGANIIFTPAAETMTGTNFSILATNANVTWAGTGNAHFNTANVTVSVATGSTLTWTSTANNNGFNFNNKATTFRGGGTMIFNDAFLANGQGAAHVMAMPGGIIRVNQNKTSNYGATAGASFTISNGTFQVGAVSAFLDTFSGFTSSDTIKINGGALDNVSGTPGTLSLGSANPGGNFSIGGNFTNFCSTSMGFAPNNPVTLVVSPTIGVAANTFTIGGVVGDGGNNLGVTKTGAGTLALTNADTYTGPTVVNGGELFVNTGFTGNGNYTVGDGATLGVTVESAGQQIHMSSLTVGSAIGGTLQFDVGLLGNPTVAPINLGAGALTVNGATAISFSSISAITNYPITIPLIAYGTAGGNLSGLTLGAFPPSSPPFQGYISNDTVNLVIDLVLTNGLFTAPPGTPKLDTWIGAINGVNFGNWDSTATNWQSGGVLTNYSNLTTNGLGDPVLFDDTVAGSTSVNLTLTLVPASITINNANSNYIFTGTGKISSGAALNLTGTGSLILDNSGNNDYVGGTTINSGVLQIGNGDTNGNPGIGPITNNSALVFNRTDAGLGSNIVLGTISGTGAVTNSGTGTINYTVIEPYTGPTVVNAGTLALSGPNTTPSALSATSQLIINRNGAVQFQSDNSMGITAAVPIVVNAGGVLTGLAASDNGSGTSSHLAGILTLNGGTLAMAGTQNNTSHGSWDLDGGVAVPGTNSTATISALTVIPSQGGGTQFNVTNGSAPSGIDLNVTGTFINGTSTHDSGITKNGPGVMALDNNNNYAAGTTINGGVLQLGASGDATALVSPLGTGPVQINGGSILNFVSAKGVIVSNGIADDSTGVVLSSRGTNTFFGTNTYGGQTIVSSSALFLKGGATINNSTLINISNSTLDASAGGVITSSGTLDLTSSTFNLGTNQITSFNALGISNSTISFPVSSSNTANITMSGVLSTGGTTNMLNLASIPGFPIYPTNLTLIRYGSFGNVDGNNNLTTLGAVLPALGAPNGYLTNDVNNLAIELVLLSDTNTPIFPITWNGKTNGVNVNTWDILATKDWVLSSDGVTAYPYQDSSVVTFDDTAHGDGTVNLTTTVAPGSLTISNASKIYAFSGAGKIAGAVALVKTNSGTATFTESGGDSFAGGIFMGGGSLTLSNSNVSISGGINTFAGTLLDQHSGTISGGVTLNGGSLVLDQTGIVSGNTVINSGGTLQVGNNDAVGTLPVGTVDDEGGLLFNRSDSALNVTTVISGAGGWTNNGTGSVTLSITETNFTGPIVVNAGMLIMNAGNNATPNGISKASELIINNSGAVGVLVDNSLSGHGGVNVLPIFVNAGGILTGAPGANAGAGTSTHITGLLTLNGGTLTNSGTSLNAANGSWDVDAGVAVPGGPVTAIIGCLDVAPSESGGVTFNVTNGTTPNGVDLDVTGTIIHATSQPDNGIIKNGPGVMRMSNTNTYNSTNNTGVGTTINGGVLVVNSPENPGVGGPLGATNAAQANLINFAGGTLRYSPVNQFDYSSRFGQGQPYSIDTAGQTVSFATAFIGGSSLTKIGNGTLSLTGANSYNGDTIAGGGKLITTTASTGAGNYTVTNGSTLDLQVLGAGAQLTMASLTLGSNSTDTSTLQIDTLATGSPTAAPVNVTVGLVTNGTMNIALSGTALTAGTFPLISYAGTSASALFHFVPPVGFSGSLSDNNAGLISVTLNAVAVGPSTNVTITKVSLSGTNMIIHGTNNNVPNTSFRYAVLSATNILTPLSNWVPVVTNQFGSGGTFDYTNPIVPGTLRQFIDIEAVP